MGLKDFFTFEGYVGDKRDIEVLEGERKICESAVKRGASDAEECAERIVQIDEQLAELRSKQK